IFANIWLTTQIAIIDPDSGEVVNFLDLAEVVDSVKLKSRQAIDVLNGIAYDEDKERLFITGKLWPELFEIRIIEKFS
ncbi:MAG TPA: glutaminyl-peptide cyclotransferase, partial [Atribacterota bacterium]|nr:glutaminyl-peptide cyclotransferase [Atribacterota bacterium]